MINPKEMAKALTDKHGMLKASKIISKYSVDTFPGPKGITFKNIHKKYWIAVRGYFKNITGLRADQTEKYLSQKEEG